MSQKSIIRLATTVSTFLAIGTEARSKTTPVLPPSQIPRPPQRPTDTIQVPEIEHSPIETPSVPPPTFTPETPQREVTLFVSKLRFIGNTVFTDEQLSELAKPYLNREISFTELVQLRSEITDLYVSNGYTTSGAYLPVEENQNVDLSAATVSIQILEGIVEDIDLSGDERLDRYVRARLDSAIAPVLNQPKLEEALRLLQIDPLVESISANLSTGTRVGASILAVQVDAQPNFQTRIGADNDRAPSVGSLHREVQISAANLLALGEQVVVGYSNTDGSDAFSAGIEIPINASNGTMAFDYAQLDGRIIEEPLDDFDIQTDSRVYGVSLRQPLVRQARESSIEEFAVGISANRTESETTLAGFPFPLSPGADEEGKTRIIELALFQEYTRQDNASALLMRSHFGVGIDAFNSTSGEEPNGQYFTWGGQAIWLQEVWGNAQLLVRGDIQLSGDKLVPISQFSLGGPGSVRGYRQDAITADNGLMVTAELAVPLLESGEDQQLSLIPFAGTGIGWNNGAQRALGENFLASVGLGAQYTWNGFTARANYAVPFTKVGIEGDSLQEEGFDLSLSYQFRF